MTLNFPEVSFSWHQLCLVAVGMILLSLYVKQYSLNELAE